jgi:hypothetical protein
MCPELCNFLGTLTCRKEGLRAHHMVFLPAVTLPRLEPTGAAAGARNADPPPAASCPSSKGPHDCGTMCTALCKCSLQQFYMIWCAQHMSGNSWGCSRCEEC